MSAYAYEARTQLASFLWDRGEPSLYCLWIAKERWPRTFGWLWRMVHVPEWQKSAVQSGFFWLLATLLIYKLVSRLGHGWQVNVVVSFTLDWVVYGINRLWVWRQRNVTLPSSGARNLAVWAVTTGLNVLLAWLIISRVGLMPGRALLGCYGVAANPAVFRIRHDFVFAETNMREVTAALRRLDAYKAASNRLMFLRT